MLSLTLPRGRTLRRTAPVFLAAFSGILATLAVAASLASAGEYEVHVCHASYGNTNNGVFGDASDGYGDTGNAGGCTPSGEAPGHLQYDYRGLQARYGVSPYAQYPGVGARLRAYIPDGGMAITRVRGNFGAYVGHAGWVGGITDLGSGAQIAAAQSWAGGWGYGDTGPNSLFTAGVEFNALCFVLAPNCGRNFSPAYQFLAKDVTLTVYDPHFPSNDNHNGGLISGTWKSGVQSVGFNTADNIGIKHAQVFVEGTQGASNWVLQGQHDYSCNYTSMRPCAGVQFPSFNVNTAGFSNGAHRVLLRTIDAAGNTTDSVHQAYFDNSTPVKVSADLSASMKAAPNRGFLGATDTGWQITNNVALSWSTNGSPTSPIASNETQVCPKAAPFAGSGNGCFTINTAGGGTSTSTGNLPSTSYGEWKARVRLVNAVGTAGPWSDEVTFKYDSRTPGTADLPRNSAVEVNGWINNTTATDFPQTAKMGAGQQKLADGAKIRGYSITVQKPGEPAPVMDNDLSDPQDIKAIDPDGETGSLVIGDVPSGVTQIKARAIGGNGKPAVADATIDLKADRDAPTVSITPSAADGVHALTVTHNVTAADVDNAQAGAAGKSGMDGAAPADPVERGGYIDMNLDAAGLQQTRGAAASMTTTSQSAHSLVYSAVDAAGNRSTVNTLGFTVAADQDGDGIPDPLDACPANPDTSCTDPNPQGGVTSINGNGGTGSADTKITWDKKCDYAQVAGLCHPLAGMAAGTPNGLNASKNAKSVLNLMSGKKNNLPVKQAKTKYGRKMPLQGTLKNNAGKPIIGAKVVIIQMVRYQKWTVLGTAKTDKKGVFKYKHKKSGPSRNWRAVYFPYAGDEDYQRSNATQQFVAAGVKTTVGPKTLRNGQAVTFKGRLLGGHIPTRGVLVNLQAFRDGRWGTFRTVRVKQSGAFTAKYRFRRTVTRSNYRFRAIVVQQSGYPFVRGTSPRRQVTVFGR